MQEDIRRNNLRLRKLEEEGARLRRKSTRMDEEIGKINIGVTQTGRANVRIRGPELADVPTILE